ncbi:unnamed protein product [Fraxinus pennsylvanica]|uniref:Protein phosphatase n=1 Tax=Fraxinus pennsylvanica TaxID=56036 RepID=A0AAD2E3X5_9LAMI|nr:unnamed protein product [Fraxinus pennsylvanica]
MATWSIIYIITNSDVKTRSITWQEHNIYYFSRFGVSFWQGVQRSISVKESGIQDPIEVLIGQGKLLIGYPRSFHSVPSETFTDLHVFLWPGTVTAAQANLHIVTFGINSRNALMAVCGSRSAPTDFSISNLTSRRVQPGVAAYHSYSCYSRRIFENCRKASMSLKNEEQPNNFLLYGYFIYNVAKRNGSSKSYPGFGFEGFYFSLSACSSTGTASDATFDSSMQEELHSSSADSADLKIPTDRTLKLNSASCYLPHPDKEETGGEDAHFICLDEQAIGVADGVGGLADLGVDAGQYARELLSNSVNAIQNQGVLLIQPESWRRLTQAQKQRLESGTAGDLPSSGEVRWILFLLYHLSANGSVIFDKCIRNIRMLQKYNLSCERGKLHWKFVESAGRGDVIVVGTDGLFDNLFNNDITTVVVHAVRAGLGPQVTAQKIAALAQQQAQDKSRQTPFSTAAQEAGFRYYGGKLDDITVVVSYIASEPWKALHPAALVRACLYLLVGVNFQQLPGLLGIFWDNTDVSHTTV